MRTERRYMYLFFLALFCRLIYTFAFTNWPNYLTSDMAGYWSRAVARWSGHDTDYLQYMLWPPMGHILLAQVFHVMSWLRLPVGCWLPGALLIQAVLGSLSCLWLVQLVRGLSGSSRLGWCTGLAWALWIPAWYWGSFLLSENIALPLLIGAARLLLVPSRLRFGGCIAGAVCALVVALRPATVAEVCIILAYALYRTDRQRVLSVISGLAVVLLLCFGELSRISHGQLSGKLSFNGGMNFALAQGQVRYMAASWPGGMFIVGLPQYYADRSKPLMLTHRRWSDEGWFYAYGLDEMIREGHWVHDLEQIPLTWLGPTFPEVADAAGWRLYEFLAVPVVAFFFITSLIVLPLAHWSGLPVQRWEWLIWSLSLSPAVLGVLFSSDRRYGYMVAWAGIALAGSLARRRRVVVLSEKSEARNNVGVPALRGRGEGGTPSPYERVS